MYMCLSGVLGVDVQAVVGKSNFGFQFVFHECVVPVEVCAEDFGRR